MNDRAKFSLSDIRRRPAALIKAVSCGPVEVTRRGHRFFVIDGGTEIVTPSDSTEAGRRKVAAEIHRAIPKARGKSAVTQLLEETRYGRFGGR